MKRTLLALVFLLTLFAVPALAQEDARIAQLENSLIRTDGTKWSMAEAMKHYGNAGLSIAVIDDYKIVWTKGYGLREADKKMPVTADTLFSCGSISKSVASVLFVLLHERGMIDIDAPVQQYLKRWQMPDNQYTRGATTSFRRFLSHTAGTTQHGFPDYYSGESVPTIVQVLNGVSPSKTSKVTVDFTPGTQHRYSGGGYQVAQLALEDYLDTDFAELADKHVFSALGMKDATYRFYGSEGFPTNIAAAHDAKGKPLAGRFPICPEQAASSLYSTTSDLALLFIDMQKALDGKESKLISKKAAEMLTTAVLDGYALGFRVRELDWVGECFAHGGSNQGIGGFFFATMSGGRGLVFLASGMNRNEINGDIARGLAEIYGWDQKPKEAVTAK